MISNPEDFFSNGCGRCTRFATDDCSARHWATALVQLRALCRNAGLTETAKWGHPCYMHAGRNIAILGAFRGDVRLTFFNSSLLEDVAGLLKKQGGNSAAPDCVRFTDAAQIAAAAPALHDLLIQAKAHAEAGRTPVKTTAKPELPDELVAALQADPMLAKAFRALTPGRQKSHVLAVSSAKASTTREARVAKLSPAILAGKGANER